MNHLAGWAAPEAVRQRAGGGRGRAGRAPSAWGGGFGPVGPVPFHHFSFKASGAVFQSTGSLDSFWNRVCIRNDGLAAESQVFSEASAAGRPLPHRPAPARDGPLGPGRARGGSAEDEVVPRTLQLAVELAWFMRYDSGPDSGPKAGDSTDPHLRPHLNHFWPPFFLAVDRLLGPAAGLAGAAAGRGREK